MPIIVDRIILNMKYVSIVKTYLYYIIAYYLNVNTYI